MVGLSQWQEPDRTAYIIFKIESKEQWINVCQYSVIFLLLCPGSAGNGATHSGLVIPY